MSTQRLFTSGGGSTSGLTAAQVSAKIAAEAQPVVRVYPDVATANADTANWPFPVPAGRTYITSLADGTPLWAQAGTSTFVQLAANEDIGRGNALPDPATTTFDGFIIESTLDAVGEPDGLYHLRAGSWIRETGTSGATTSDIGIGNTLPDPATTTFKAFIVQSTLDAVGEPDGLYHLRSGGWIRETGTSGSISSEIGTGNTLPDPAVTTFKVFIVQSTLDPVGEPDGLYHLRSGSWVRDAGTSGSAAEIGTGSALPDATTSTYGLFVVSNSLDPVGEPDGAYVKYLGSWVRV